MAGTLTISTLSDGTNSTSSTNCIQGSAKAWVNFNGVGTPAIRASYNVSSITKTSTGVFTITFATAMSDANYAAVGTARNTSVGNTCVESRQDNVNSTTSVSMGCFSPGAGSQDPTWFSVSIFR